MLDLTLSGTIPGLLRWCSPVICLGARFIVHNSIVRGRVNIGAEVIVSAEDVALDLTDATGRAHAAWWLAMREVPSSHHLDPAAASWSRAPAQAAHGWAMHWLARAVVGDGSLTGTWWTGSYGSPVPRGLLADLDPNDDTRLPDGSRRVDAEALRRAVLHVAGVTNG